MKPNLKWTVVAMLILAAGLVTLKMIGPPSCFASAYYTCQSRAGTCPAPMTGGGYPCTNADTVCEQGSGGNEDLRCKTKAHWFWNCTCECSS